VLCSAILEHSHVLTFLQIVCVRGRQEHRLHFARLDSPPKMKSFGPTDWKPEYLQSREPPTDLVRERRTESPRLRHCHQIHHAPNSSVQNEAFWTPSNRNSFAKDSSVSGIASQVGSQEHIGRFVAVHGIQKSPV
jgi:hypothetical protein